MRRPLAVMTVLAVLAAGGCAHSSRGDDTSAGGSGSSTVPASQFDPSSVPSTSNTTANGRDRNRLTARMQGALDAFVADHRVPFSVVAEDVGTGVRVEHLADRVVLSASLYKLFVARELLRRIDAGAMDGDGEASDGQGRTIGECVQLMIVVSDNDCGLAGLRLVGASDLDASLHEEGFGGTTLGSPQQTSADDVALFFERLRDASPVNDALHALLAAQQINDRIPTGLPGSTPVAHKTGDRRQWAHDAGLITTPDGDLLLVVMSGPWPSPCCDADHPGAAEATAFGAIADLATAMYGADTS